LQVIPLIDSRKLASGRFGLVFVAPANSEQINAETVEPFGFNTQALYCGYHEICKLPFPVSSYKFSDTFLSVILRSGVVIENFSSQRVHAVVVVFGSVVVITTVVVSSKSLSTMIGSKSTCSQVLPLSCKHWKLSTRPMKPSPLTCAL